MHTVIEERGRRMRLARLSALGHWRGIRLLRRALDALYFGCGLIAAAALVTLLLLILSQMLARWTGMIFGGATAYSGYAMATASFFAFAHALDRGAHIRVSLLMQAVPTRVARWLDTWCFAVATFLAWYFVRYAFKAVYWSHKLHDISQGQDATPLWIPQLGMAIGAAVFAVALTDHFVRLLVTGDSGVRTELAEEQHGE